ncbi:hypothetical protein [Streptomyces sp. SAJ15]|uniref:hypothetical protein n=1 Tax=Streptomyces sp. SAJ15 TaxID=2011095 RepID=UPI0011851A7B|nr:hypothetical protein [Streptomyces sp. SAJ15]TVL88438.1 hypothetical protein CD790_30725 [Streptomyces sp. SAJ15]
MTTPPTGQTPEPTPEPERRRFDRLRPRIRRLARTAVTITIISAASLAFHNDQLAEPIGTAFTAISFLHTFRRR